MSEGGRPVKGRAVRNRTVDKNQYFESGWTKKEVDLARGNRRREWLLKQRPLECAVCHIAEPRVLVVDHIVPLSLGGRDRPSNWQVLCHNCNAVKGPHGDQRGVRKQLEAQERRRKEWFKLPDLGWLLQR